MANVCAACVSPVLALLLCRSSTTGPAAACLERPRCGGAMLPGCQAARAHARRRL